MELATVRAEAARYQQPFEPATPEERAAEAAQRRERNAAREHFRLSAEQRAEGLLLSCLTEEQRESLRCSNAFVCVSNLGNVFRITRARVHGVFKLDASGNVIEEWCVTLNGQLPIADIMLAQKIALETDEQEIERRANVKVLSTGRLRSRAAVGYNPVREDYRLAEAAE